MKNFDCNIFVKRANELFWDKSQQEIAKEVGISQTYVSSIKSGKIKSPGADTVFRIAEYYNVSADWLLGLSDCKTTDKTTREICKTIGLSGNTIDFLAEIWGSDSFVYKNIRNSVCKGIDFLVQQTQNVIKEENYHLALLPLLASYAELSDESTITTDVFYKLIQEKNTYNLYIYSSQNGELKKLSETNFPYLPGFCDTWNDYNSFRDIWGNSIINNISYIMRNNLEKLQAKRDDAYIDMLDYEYESEKKHGNNTKKG